MTRSTNAIFSLNTIVYGVLIENQNDATLAPLSIFFIQDYQGK